MQLFSVDGSDKRNVIKLKLDAILNKNIDNSKLFKAITNANRLIDMGYMFIRAFLLFAIENDKIIKTPKIDADFINLAFSVISSPEIKRGRPFNADKSPYLNVLQDYFVNKFKPKTNVNIIPATNLSFILAQAHEQMHTSIINNIKYHFEKHVWKYLLTIFIDEYNIIKTLKNTDKLKEYYSELEKVKNDLFDNTKTSNVKYHAWIDLNKPLIIPVTYTNKLFESDVEKNTFGYLKCMYVINKYLQEKEVKSYQIFPLRTGCYLHHIKINTSALIDIFYGIPDMKQLKKNEYLRKCGNKDVQEKLWNCVFNLKENEIDYRYTRKGFSFNYEIDTDGFAVSLNMINDNEIPNKDKKKAAFKNGRDKTNENKRNMTEDEFKEFQINKNKLKDTKTENQKIADKENRAKKKSEFNKLSKEEQEKIKNELNNLSEFPYIEKILADPKNRELFLKDFANGRLIFCDPGKRSPLYFMASNGVIHKKKKILRAKITNEHEVYKRKMKKGGTGTNNFGISFFENHKIMNYTNNTRIKFLKRKKYAQLIESWKRKTSTNKFKSVDNINDDLWKQKSLKNIEQELSEYNAKSCIHDKFIDYIIKKLEYNKKAKEQYDTSYLQKLKWFNYLNKNKHENDLLNHIQNEFGKKIKIIIGDWSGKGRVKFMSTPNISLKRKLAERFEVYLIDEYLTSKIHYKHQVRCDNLTVKIEKISENQESTKKIRTIPKKINKKVNLKAMSPQPFDLKRLHAVLTYSLVDDMGCKKPEMGCINRDKNSVLNMETIVKELLLTGNRPDIYKRESNQPNLKTDRKKSVKVNLDDATGAITESYVIHDTSIKKRKSAIKSIQSKSTSNSNLNESDVNHLPQSLIQIKKFKENKSITNNTGKRKKSVNQ